MYVILAGVAVGLVTSYLWYLLTSKRATNDDQWKDQHVVITGGSSGLGRAFAVHVAKEGARVTLVSRDAERLKEAVRYVKEQCSDLRHLRVHSVAFDVTTREEDPWYQLVKNVYSHSYGPPDCLVACAGSASPAMFVDTPMAVFEQQVDLNYLGVVRTVKAFSESMRKRARDESGRRRRIIVVSSAAALASIPGYTAYAASKYALRGFCDALRPEMLKYDIDVHLFYPSNIDTPGYAEENRTKPAVTKAIEGSVSLCSPEEAAACLCSGVNKGQYHITTELLMDVVRTTSNGITPRNHLLLETLLLSLMPLVELYYRTQVIEREARK